MKDLPRNTMRLSGKIEPGFYKKKDTYLPSNRKNLFKVFDNFYHVDTYYDDKNDFWRVQGYIYLKDLPEGIPEELENSQCDLVVTKNDRVILEVWRMEIRNDFPF